MSTPLYTVPTSLRWTRIYPIKRSIQNLKASCTVTSAVKANRPTPFTCLHSGNNLLTNHKNPPIQLLQMYLLVLHLMQQCPLRMHRAKPLPNRATHPITTALPTQTRNLLPNRQMFRITFRSEHPKVHMFATTSPKRRKEIQGAFLLAPIALGMNHRMAAALGAENPSHYYFPIPFQDLMASTHLG